MEFGRFNRDRYRLEGREEQIRFDDPETNNPDRTILGHVQVWVVAIGVNQLYCQNGKYWAIQVVFTTINTLGLVDNNDMGRLSGRTAQGRRFD